MIDKKEIDFLYIATTRALKCQLAAQSDLDELEEYVKEHFPDNEELNKLVSELEKGLRKRDHAEGVVLNIIHYHYEENQE